jgi:hypothetical protein
MGSKRGSDSSALYAQGGTNCALRPEGMAMLPIGSYKPERLFRPRTLKS